MVKLASGGNDSVALRVRTAHSGRLRRLGCVLRDQGDVAGAVAAYKRAVWMAPKHAGFHFFLGQLLLDRGDVDEALKAFYTAIENLKKNQNDGPSATQAHYLYNYGMALLAKGDTA